MKTLPRAPLDRLCALSGKVYNDMAAGIEGANKIAVAPPLMVDDTPTGKVLRIAIPQGIFPVTLSSPSGSAGTNSPPAAATYTYTVSDANTGNQIATSVSVWFARQLGHVTAATKGLATYINGTLYILFCDEVIDATTC